MHNQSPPVAGRMAKLRLSSPVSSPNSSPTKITFRLTNLGTRGQSWPGGRLEGWRSGMMSGDIPG